MKNATASDGLSALLRVQARTAPVGWSLRKSRSVREWQDDWEQLWGKKKRRVVDLASDPGQSLSWYQPVPDESFFDDRNLVGESSSML